MVENLEVTPGLYKHYRGGLFLVMCIAKLAYKEAHFVVYKAVSSDSEATILPLHEFTEHVRYRGNVVPRFCRYADVTNMNE